MLYTQERFKTKKSFKEAVAKGGVPIYGYGLPSLGYSEDFTGRDTVCGPAEDDRRWFAAVWVEKGVVTKVIS